MQNAFIVSFGRWILPVIALYIIIGCGVSLVRGNKKTGTIGYLVNSANGDEIPLISYETSIGRSNACDIVLAYTTVSRFHAVIAKRHGEWMVFDTNSKTGTFVGEERVIGITGTVINSGDTVVFGNAPFKFFERLPKVQDTETEETEDNPALFLGDEKFYTGEIIIPSKIKKGCKLRNCITGEEMNIDDMDNILIGRGPDSHIRINSQAVSKVHALISRSGNDWIVEDLDSANGTLLNGEPVTGCTVLHNDDIIEICGFTIKFING